MPASFSIITCSIEPKKYSKLKKSIDSHFDSAPQLILIEDAKSLSEGYNRGIEQATGDILIFCHDDIEFIGEHIDSLVEEDLKELDLVGVAGTSRLCEGSWISAGHPYCHGHVAHSRESGQFGYCLYGLGADPYLTKDIQALDGLFYAIKRSSLGTLRYDETTFDKFHGYDLDFSYSAYLGGLKVGIDYRLELLHDSGGNYDQIWLTYKQRFDHKFKQQLADLPTPHLPHFGKTILGNEAVLQQTLKALATHPPVQINQLEDCKHHKDNSLLYIHLDNDIQNISDKITLMNELWRIGINGSHLMISLDDTIDSKPTCWNKSHLSMFTLNHDDTRVQRRGFVGTFLLQACDSGLKQGKHSVILSPIKDKQQIKQAREQLRQQKNHV